MGTIIMIVSILAAIAMLLIFLVPTILAFSYGTKHRWWILVLNVFFGGTILLWIAALIWTFTDTVE